MPSVFPGAIKPATPFRSPVPIPVLGTGDVTVTFDQAWLPYILGACKVLVAAATWDPPTQADVANTIFAAYDLLKTLSGAAPAVPSVPFGCGDDCMGCAQLRFNNCVLQQFDCVTQTWVDVPTIGNCTPTTAPGEGVTPPGAGKCQDYQFQFQANALTPLPFVVNTGDTLTINALKGAGTDGTLDWYCPDGEYFIAGACAGGQHTVSTDPLNTSPHMSVVLRIGSTYYPFSSGVFTVPGSIVNAHIYIGVNDSSLTDDAGTYSMDLNYCNNVTPPVGTWCHMLDFTISPAGIVSYAVNDGCPAPVNVANWQSGVGWVVPAYTISCDPTHTQFQGTIALDMGLSTTLTSVEIEGNYSGGATGSRFIDVGLNTTPPWSSSVLHPISQSGYAAGNYNYSSGAISQACRYIQIDIADTSHGTPAGTTGYTITKLILKGTGTSPFGPDNC